MEHSEAYLCADTKQRKKKESFGEYFEENLYVHKSAAAVDG
jgi:hypothetical protein